MRTAWEPSGGARQAVEAEEAYVVARDPGLRQVGHDLAYHARELIAVPGAGRFGLPSSVSRAALPATSTPISAMDRGTSAASDSASRILRRRPSSSWRGVR